MTFQDPLSCRIYEEQKASDKCTSSTLALKIFLGLVWTLIELYFAFILYCFYSKTVKGFYGPMGSPPIFPEIYNASQNTMYKKAIILEVKGMKMKDSLKENILGYPIECLKQSKVNFKMIYLFSK